jgi:hypothetical protein
VGGAEPALAAETLPVMYPRSSLSDVRIYARGAASTNVAFLLCLIARER